MATAQLSVNVYRINQKPAIPLASVTKISFPTGNVKIRAANGAAGINLGNTVTVYGIIQDAAGNQFFTLESQSALVTLANT